MALKALKPSASFSESTPCSFKVFSACSNCIIALAIALACSSPALANRNTLSFSAWPKLPNSLVKDRATASPSNIPLLNPCITSWKLSANPGNTVINPNAASLNPTAPMLAASTAAAAISPPTSPPIPLITEINCRKPLVNCSLVCAGNVSIEAISIWLFSNTCLVKSLIASVLTPNAVEYFNCICDVSAMLVDICRCCDNVKAPTLNRFCLKLNSSPNISLRSLRLIPRLIPCDVKS